MVNLCYRPTASPHPGEPASGIQEALVGDDRRTCPKRSKINGSKYWKPALSVISEDGVVPFPENEQTKVQVQVQTEKKVSSKTRSTAGNKARSSQCYHEFDYYSRKSSTPVIVPVFSPTPFLF